jgi:large subunit ribosomal protein L4
MPAALDPSIFEVPVRPDLLHAVVVSQMAARRRGTHATKNRAQVSGGGRKPYKQKGTGRARQGTIRASQFAGGGIAFGPQPRSYEQRLNKKVRRAALRSALSLRKREDAILQVDDFDLPEAKTRLVAKRLAELGAEDVLIVTRERDLKLELAARNLKTVRVLAVGGLNVRDILLRRKLVLVGDAPAAIAERLQ